MKMMMIAVMVAGVMTSGSAQAQQTKIPPSITTPDKIESRIGTLRFKDGYPVGDTAGMRDVVRGQV